MMAMRHRRINQLMLQRYYYHNLIGGQLLQVHDQIKIRRYLNLPTTVLPPADDEIRRLLVS